MSRKDKGWLLPETVTDEPTVCVQFKIPDVDEYRAAALGAIYQLGQWFSWQKTGGDDRRATDTAAVMRRLLYDTLVFSVECGDVTLLLRQNPEDPCQLEQSTNGGSSWSLAFDYGLCFPTDRVTVGEYQAEQQRHILENQRLLELYDGSTTSVDPDAPTTDFDWGDDLGEEALCTAVWAWVRKVVYDTFVQLAILAGIAGLIGGFGWLAGLPGIILGAIVSLVAGLSAAVAQAAFSDLEAQRLIACQLVEALKGVAITKANWTAAIAALTSATTNQGTVVGELKANSTTDSHWVYFLKLLGASRRYVEAGKTDCPCQDECEFFYDFRLYVPDNVEISQGFWEADEGIRDAVGSAGIFVITLRFDEPCHPDSFRYNYTYSANHSFGLGYRFGDIQPDGSITWRGTGTFSGPSTAGTHVHTVGVSGATDPWTAHQIFVQGIAARATIHDLEYIVT